MKLLLAYPPTPYLVNPDAQTGLGLLYLATLVRDLGAEVEVRRLRSVVLKDADCDALLLTGCTIDEPALAAVAASAKEAGVPFVAVGGPVADHPKWERGVGPFDAVIRGPGEPFIERLMAKGPEPGFCEIPDDQPFDRWPFPDRRLLGGETGGNIFHPKAGAGTRSTTLLTARGCRHRCAFCRSGGRGFRHEYHWDRLCDELDAIERLGISDVRITDDSVTADQGRLETLCSVLPVRKLRWRASSRAVGDWQVWRRVAEAGCLEVNIGIESGDPAVLRAIRKGSTVAAGHAAVDAAREAGLHVRALFMTGTPGETEETLALNKQWVERHPDATVCLTSFVPFPGTAIWREPERFGVRIEIQSGNASFYSFRPDGSEPEAHLSIVGGMTRDALTANLREFRRWLIERGQHNEG